MPSNDELMRAAETILAQEDTQSHHWNSNSPELILARHVKSTLASDKREQAITPDKLASLGFRKYGHAFDMTVERNGERQFDLMLAHIGVMWTVHVEANLASVPIVSISEMAELLALLSALGIEVKQ